MIQHFDRLDESKVKTCHTKNVSSTFVQVLEYISNMKNNFRNEVSDPNFIILEALHINLLKLLRKLCDHLFFKMATDHHLDLRKTLNGDNRSPHQNLFPIPYTI